MADVWSLVPDGIHVGRADLVEAVGCDVGETAGKAAAYLVLDREIVGVGDGQAEGCGIEA
jgi:hypothetical protein